MVLDLACLVVWVTDQNGITNQHIYNTNAGANITEHSTLREISRFSQT